MVDKGTALSAFFSKQNLPYKKKKATECFASRSEIIIIEKKLLTLKSYPGPRPTNKQKERIGKKNKTSLKIHTVLQDLRTII